MMQSLSGRILTPSGWVDGTVSFGQRVQSVVADARASADAGRIVLPGFIDLHVHGGGGADVMDGGDAARHGTSSLLATTMTAPTREIEHALLGCASGAARRGSGEARILGVHLEGPYINPGRLGAQPDFAQTGSLDAFDGLSRLASIKLVTVAPEVAAHLALIAALAERGVRVQLGHSNASYEEGRLALEAGASGFAHLFNAMSGMHHRNPGLVGTALAHARFAEIIPDLLHVHPGAIRAALRAIPRLYCVTDGTSAVGMPDGEYRLGRHLVRKCLGGVRLADGTLAGSALTMDQALRNLVDLGLDLADASARTSRYAAEFLGLEDRGVIAQGAWADLVVLDADLRIVAVHVEGERIDLADAP